MTEGDDYVRMPGWHTPATLGPGRPRRANLGARSHRASATAVSLRTSGEGVWEVACRVGGPMLAIDQGGWTWRDAATPTDLTDAQWAALEPHLPAARTGGRPRRTDLRAVVDAILYLLRTGCQWRLIPSDFPPWSTVWWYLPTLAASRALGRGFIAPCTVRRVLAKGQNPEPAVVIMDSQSVKTTEKGAFAALMATSG